jgi:hypothetical protein
MKRPRTSHGNIIPLTRTVKERFEYNTHPLLRPSLATSPYFKHVAILGQLRSTLAIGGSGHTSTAPLLLPLLPLLLLLPKSPVPSGNELLGRSSLSSAHALVTGLRQDPRSQAKGPLVSNTALAALSRASPTPRTSLPLDDLPAVLSRLLPLLKLLIGSVCETDPGTPPFVVGVSIVDSSASVTVAASTTARHSLWPGVLGTPAAATPSRPIAKMCLTVPP